MRPMSKWKNQMFLTKKHICSFIERLPYEQILLLRGMQRVKSYKGPLLQLKEEESEQVRESVSINEKVGQ